MPDQRRDRYEPARQDDIPTAPLARALDVRRLTVPLTVLAGAALVVGGWVWWLAAADARLSAIEAAQAELRRTQQEQAASMDIHGTRLGDVRIREAEILTRLSGIEGQLAEIKIILRDRRP